MIAGIGGTGVVTIGAVLATAAQIDGRGSGVLDMTGLAQKGGAVKSFLRILKNRRCWSNQIILWGYKLTLGFDLLVSNDLEIIKTLDKKISKLIINTDEVMPGDFTRDKDFYLPFEEMRNNLINIAGLENIKFISSNKITSKILGNSILSNMFNVGIAYQSGLIPISASSIEKAIELNGASVKDNIDAFRFGRHYENLKEEVINILKDEPEILEDFDAKYQNRFKFLEDYQNTKYAQNYEDLVSYAKKIDKKVGNGSQFSTAVLKNYLN